MIYFEEPELPARPQVNLRKPTTKDEHIYCHHFWCMYIQEDPRYVLDNLDDIPVFTAYWGNYRQNLPKMEHERSLMSRTQRMNRKREIIKKGL